MKIEKIVENGNVILNDDGIEKARISAELSEDILKIALQGIFSSAIESYLQNELDFYAASGILKFSVDCGKIEAVFPGSFLSLLDFRSKVECRGGTVEFLNKPDNLKKFEKSIGSNL